MQSHSLEVSLKDDTKYTIIVDIEDKITYVNVIDTRSNQSAELILDQKAMRQLIDNLKTAYNRTTSS